MTRRKASVNLYIINVYKGFNDYTSCVVPTSKTIGSRKKKIIKFSTLIDMDVHNRI